MSAEARRQSLASSVNIRVQGAGTCVLFTAKAYNCEMGITEVIVGGAGGGKTHEIVSRLGRFYKSDPFGKALILVPTIRHGDQLRRRLMAICPVALNLRVETFGIFSRDVIAHEAVLSQSTADELLRRVARRVVARGGAAYFAPIVDTGGFLTLIADAVGGLMEEEIEPGDFRRAAAESGSQKLQALAFIYSAYVAHLREHGLTHPLQVPARAVDAIADSAPIPDVIMADGFQKFSSIELSLLSSLAARSDLVVTMDPGAGKRAENDYQRLLSRLPNAVVTTPATPTSEAGTIIFKGEAADPEQQIRAMARQIKQRLVADPALRPSDCAITFRQVMPHLSLIRSVFEEYELPLDPAAGERLSERPLGVWLRRLLSLDREGWRAGDIVAILGNGIVNLKGWNATDDGIGRFRAAAREAEVWAGYESMDTPLNSMAESGPEDVAAAAGLRAALDDIKALLDALDTEVGDKARVLQSTLFGEDPWLRRDATSLSGVDEEDVNLLQTFLRDLSAGADDSNDAEEPETLEAFEARLMRKLEMPVLMRRRPGGVLLAPMHTLHGLRFDFVAIGGLVEGEFPARRSIVELLDDEGRDALKTKGLQLPPRSRLSESELWETVVSRAKGTTALWRTRMDERGRSVAASWSYDDRDADEMLVARGLAPEEAASTRELAIECARSESALRPAGLLSWRIVRNASWVEGQRRSFQSIGSHEGQLRAGLTPNLTGDSAQWSASRLQSYQTCAFQFFGAYALNLKDQEDEMDEADAATRGTVIHEILENAVKPLIESGEPISEATVELVRRRVDTIGREIWDRAPQEHKFGRAALWRVSWNRGRRDILGILNREVSATGMHRMTRVVSVEDKLDGTLPTSPPMRVNARIDRIDESDSHLLITDYKSGRPPTRSRIQEGRYVQLQVYAQLAQANEMGRGKEIVVRYSSPPTSGSPRPWSLDTANVDDEEVIDDVVQIASNVRDSVVSGDFRVNPQDAECPTYCEFKHICRVSHYSRWKEWN